MEAVTQNVTASDLCEHREICGWAVATKTLQLNISRLWLHLSVFNQYFNAVCLVTLCIGILSAQCQKVHVRGEMV